MRPERHGAGTDMRETHRRLQSGTTIGKPVLAGWN